MYRGVRIAATLFAFVLVLSLAGCREKETRVETVDKPDYSVVLHLFSSGSISSTSDQAKYWSEHFSEIVGDNVEIDYEDSSYYAEGSQGLGGRELLRKRIESDRPDDMYIVSAEDMIEFARKGYILDMSDFDFVDNLSDAARQLSTIDGKVYCLPLAYTGYGLYWNTELLQKYGLEIPKNYGELIYVWDTLKENGITPYVGNKGYALTVPAMCLGLSEVYQSENRDQLLADLANGTTPISTYMRKGFEFIQLMCDKGYFNPSEALATAPSSEEEIAQFVNGQVACVCSVMDTQAFYDKERTGFVTHMTGWPLLEDGAVSVVGTTQKLCANPDSKYPEIVKEFIEMAGTKEALIQITKDGAVSSGKINDPSKYRSSESVFDALIQSDGQIPNTDMNLKLNLWDNIRDISRLILSGDATVEEACRMLDESQKQDIAASVLE